MRRACLPGVLLLLAGCPIVSHEDLDQRKDQDGDGVGYLQDCDDSRVDVYPRAPELCDGVDNDCDGEVDEIVVDLYADEDGDGFGGELREEDVCFDENTELGEAVTVGDDCDDERPDVYPGAPIVCDGSMVCDDHNLDCSEDGSIDCDDDRDGHSSQVCGGSDSNDDDDDQWEASFDWKHDGWDDNLDGWIDEHHITEDSPRLEGSVRDWELGSSVSLSGDLNGDGVNDLVVGAHLADRAAEDGEEARADAGAVFVMYGSTELFEDDLIYPGDEAEILLWGRKGAQDGIREGDQLGTQVLVYDFTGGVTDDLLVLARHEEWTAPDGTPGGSVGAVHLMAGPVRQGETLDDAYASWYGTSEHQSLASVFAGDLDNDGAEDILIGCADPYTDTSPGTIHFFPGPIISSTPQSVNAASGIVHGVYEGDNIGSPDRACVLDFTGDGAQDLVIGSPLTPRSGDYPVGAVYVVADPPVFGSRDGLVEFTADERGVPIRGESRDTRIGDRVSPAGDMDGGGYGDFLVMGTKTDDDCVGCGSVYLVFGTDLEAPATLDDPDIAVEIQGEEEGVWLGSFAVSVGDVDGDLRPDLLLGGASSFFVFRGPLSPGSGSLTTADADAVLPVDATGFADTEQMPFPAAGGDVNADGIGDFALPDPTWGQNIGRVYLFFGAEI
jgi:hypothetical protein